MSALPEDVQFYTVKEVSTYLRVSHMTIYRAINAGDLKVLQMGNSIRIPVANVESWLEQLANSRSFVDHGNIDEE